MGINCKSYYKTREQNPTLDIRELSLEDMQCFKKNLSLPRPFSVPVPRTSYKDKMHSLENYPDYRTPFYNYDLPLEKILIACAQKHYTLGIKKIVISFPEIICSPDRIKLFNTLIPQLYEKYGIDIKFLISFSTVLNYYNHNVKKMLETLKKVQNNLVFDGIMLGEHDNATIYEMYSILNNGIFHFACLKNKTCYMHIRNTPPKLHQPSDLDTALRLTDKLKMNAHIKLVDYHCPQPEKISCFIEEKKLQKRVVFEMPLPKFGVDNAHENTQHQFISTLMKNNIPFVFIPDAQPVDQLMLDFKKLNINDNKKLSIPLDYPPEIEISPFLSGYLPSMGEHYSLWEKPTLPIQQPPIQPPQPITRLCVLNNNFLLTYNLKKVEDENKYLIPEVREKMNSSMNNKKI